MIPFCPIIKESCRSLDCAFFRPYGDEDEVAEKGFCSLASLAVALDDKLSAEGEEDSMFDVFTTLERLKEMASSATGSRLADINQMIAVKQAEEFEDEHLRKRQAEYPSLMVGLIESLAVPCKEWAFGRRFKKVTTSNIEFFLVLPEISKKLFIVYTDGTVNNVRLTKIYKDMLKEATNSLLCRMIGFDTHEGKP